MMLSRAIRKPSMLLLAIAFLNFEQADASGVTPPAIIEQGKPSEPQELCKGYEEEFTDCHLPDCVKCTPVDCKFGDWSAWVEHGGCSGLEMRQRSIKISNNECGEPCAGVKEETRRSAHIKPECEIKVVPCAFTAWSHWSKCTSDLGQSSRQREFLHEAQSGGDACEGLMKETKPCGHEKPPVDCVFDDWQDWTACSSTCGTGRHTKMRVVLTEAMNGGVTCKGALLITEDCEDKKCPNQDCAMGAWAEWSVCHKGDIQKTRHRKVAKPVMGEGKACDDIVREIVPCKPPESKPCELSEWSSWTECDKTCDGGQMFKRRELMEPAKHGGSCPPEPLEITSPCHTVPCTPPPEHCKVEEWGEWGKCSSECGPGNSVRTRDIKSYAKYGGDGCTAPMTESKPCVGKKLGKNGTTACEEEDCKWSEWYDWSACSCKCGGGTKRRNRVVKQAPQHGGKMCEPLDKSEAAPCNTQPCERTCIDGKWGAWQSWSNCSATCDEGYRSRSRVVATEANTCGKQLEGPHTQYEKCPKALPPCVPDKDCVLGEWGDWSDCSCTCFGIMERMRVIKTFVSGKGKACHMDSLKEMAPCNPTVGGEIIEQCGNKSVINCGWAEWGDWSTCDRPCGGGQRRSHRKINHTAQFGGLPCQGPSDVIQACHRDGGDQPGDKPCGGAVCEDCLFGPWGDWSQCSHCGKFSNCGGQKFRHRVPMRLPNYCGKPCANTTTKEVTNCTHGMQDIYTCRWSDWSAPSGCGGCGPAVATRNRVLGFNNKPAPEKFIIFNGSKSALCSGSQIDLEACTKPASCPVCEPRDCTFNAWGDWAPPACDGLCERKRTVKEVNNHCGDPCHGPLVVTKKCNATCFEKVDCEFSPWSEWSACTDEFGQKSKHRTILVFPKKGGAACEGPMQKTIPCSLSIEPKDCKLSEWTPFTTCSATCGGGVKTRKRGITDHAEFGGELCNGALKEIDSCGTGSCGCKDCTFTEWGDWGGCQLLGQRYRYRSAFHPKGCGYACEGPTEETMHCPHPPVDCVVGEWTAWDKCDRSCGGGQKRRQRQIQTFNKNGGKACGWPESEASLMQTTGCNSHPCGKEDCEMGKWAGWSTCSVSCGFGQRGRTREITHMRTDGGDGCEANLVETEACGSDPTGVKGCDVTDCLWGDWSAWSGCTCTCEGGMKTRTRHIINAPRGGGAECPEHTKEEVKPCNTGPCPQNCRDGSFGPWSPWTQCSASCGGGATYRIRKIAVIANQCGNPPEGKEMETKFCNVDVSCAVSIDCEFGEWDEWSDCTMTCDGVKRRERRISQYGYGDGKFCIGPLKETSPCSPGVGEALPAACDPTAPPVDCVMEEWSEWSPCSKSCGEGLHRKSRKVHITPQNRGKPCPKLLEVVQQCNLETCDTPDPIDCKVGDWQDWGGCYKCGGLRKRFRHILRYPKFDGTACPKIATEEIGACDRECHAKTYCTWQDWDEWSKCLAKCGAAKKSRKRYLETTTKKPASHITGSVRALVAEYSDTLHRTQHLQDERGRIQDLSLAFAGGGLTLVVGLAIWRVSSWNGNRRELVPQREEEESFDRHAAEMRVPLGAE